MKNTWFGALENLAEAGVKVQEVKEYIDEVIHSSGEYNQDERIKKSEECLKIMADIGLLMKWILK